MLYGHSLGGLIALGYALDARAWPDAIVASAPAIEATVAPWKRALARVMARVAPRATIANGIDPAVLMADEAGRAAYPADPLCFHRTTTRFAVLAFDEQRRVAGSLDRLSIPTLVVHGGLDTLVPVESSEVCEGLPAVTRRVYDGLLHEVHNEAEGARVIDEVVTWIREQASRLAVLRYDGPQLHTPPGSAIGAESVAQPQTRGT